MEEQFAVLRALFVNVTSGEIRQGASTLTQQLVRSYFLSNERTLSRKLREALAPLCKRTKGIENVPLLVAFGADMRRGLETLRITEMRWKQIGLAGFGPPIHVSCKDHNGHGSVYVQQWDGHKWVKVSAWITPVTSKVVPLLDAAAKDYVTKNQPWPKRTEKCDDGTLSIK